LEQELKKIALNRLMKSRKQRLEESKKKNTPENVVNELMEINKNIDSMYPDKDDYELQDRLLSERLKKYRR